MLKTVELADAGTSGQVSEPAVGKIHSQISGSDRPALGDDSIPFDENTTRSLLRELSRQIMRWWACKD